MSLVLLCVKLAKLLIDDLLAIVIHAEVHQSESRPDLEIAKGQKAAIWPKEK